MCYIEIIAERSVKMKELLTKILTEARRWWHFQFADTDDRLCWLIARENIVAGEDSKGRRVYVEFLRWRGITVVFILDENLQVLFFFQFVDYTKHYQRDGDRGYFFKKDGNFGDERYYFDRDEINRAWKRVLKETHERTLISPFEEYSDFRKREPKTVATVCVSKREFFKPFASERSVIGL